MVQLAIRSTSIFPVRDYHRQVSRVIVRIDRAVNGLDAFTIASGSLRAAIEEAGLEYGFCVSDGLSYVPNEHGSLIHTYEAPLMVYHGKPYDLRIILA